MKAVRAIHSCFIINSVSTYFINSISSIFRRLYSFAYAISLSRLNTLQSYPVYIQSFKMRLATAGFPLFIAATATLVAGQSTKKCAAQKSVPIPRQMEDISSFLLSTIHLVCDQPMSKVERWSIKPIIPLLKREREKSSIQNYHANPNQFTQCRRSMCHGHAIPTRKLRNI